MGQETETELVFKYEEIMKEENLQLNDIPVEIRKTINALKPNYARFQRQPSDAMREALIRQDIEIANSIYDWLEEHAEDEEKKKADEAAALAAAAKKKADEEAAALAATEAKKKADEEAALVDAEAEAKKKSDEEAAAAAAAEEAKNKAEESETTYKFGDAEMVKSIKEKIESNGGHILISELKAIIKKEPEYPHQEVYNIRLHKPYMKPFYKIV